VILAILVTVIFWALFGGSSDSDSSDSNNKNDTKEEKKLFEIEYLTAENKFL
jgi:hypothetical protein